jgi:hypothetical protein
MKTKWMGVLMVLGLACFAGSAVAADAPAVQPQPVVEAPAPIEQVAPIAIEGLEAEATCENAVVSTAETAVANDLVESADAVVACKPCKGRTWCKCTYNGSPRSSCDPCCYTNDIGVTVCLD